MTHLSKKIEKIKDISLYIYFHICKCVEKIETNDLIRELNWWIIFEEGTRTGEQISDRTSAFTMRLCGISHNTEKMNAAARNDL